jgi:hypothetical protein
MTLSWLYNSHHIHEHEQFVVPHEESRIFVWTSLGFALPAYYAYRHKQYFYSALSIATSAISLLYWHRPTYGWRRNLDLIFAKLSFTMYFLTAYMYLETSRPSYSVAFYGGTPVMLLFYGLSSYCIQPWWLYHSLFHLMVIAKKLMIIDILRESNKKDSL